MILFKNYIYKLVIFIITILIFHTVYSKTTVTDSITDCSTFEDLTKYLHQPFIDTYGEDKRPYINFDYFVFSPTGQYVACILSGIESGDSEQVWLIDLNTKKVRLVTEPLIPNKIGLNVKKPVWFSNDTLAMNYHRISWKAQSKNRTVRIKATIDSTYSWPSGKKLQFTIEKNDTKVSPYFDLRFENGNEFILIDKETGIESK